MGSEERQQELFSSAEDEADTSSTPSANQPTQAETVESVAEIAAVNRGQGREFQTIPLDESVVYVIDSYALIYQLFFALPPMSGPSGQPIGAIHGYVRDIVELIESKSPTHVIAVFDPPGKVFRHEFYPEYKANRDPMPDDLRNQIPKYKANAGCDGDCSVRSPEF